jgi:hypothetical protein
VTSVSARLPENLRPNFVETGRMYSGDVRDQKINANARIIMGVTAPRQQDQITDMVCIFQRPDIAADSAVLGEAKGCLAAILPKPDQAIAAAWLDANAAKLGSDDIQRTNIGPASVRISHGSDNITVGVLALQPSPSPTAGR